MDGGWFLARPHHAVIGVPQISLPYTRQLASEDLEDRKCGDLRDAIVENLLKIAGYKLIRDRVARLSPLIDRRQRFNRSSPTYMSGSTRGPE